ncbi:M48 family metallopeptidase [Ovoidimarina sediminis]|uniref:M48 family metallopeptidase n=1 Tax=Ovoidimarina sediminis TaxID=3079856 RepID=UPI002907C863|nr:SprT family zinc-dependent metalloprotease [Rhodophyticola sp. MJ-SS7]MDU8944618.1 SprT family zinc-dependent metalloprotease [Rhodophyticola sp. MJ-SS7]
MSHEILTLEGAEPIEVLVRRSAQARRLSLRVSSLDGRVTLTVPRRARMSEARAFVESRRPWIEGARGRSPGLVTVADGVVLPVLGEPVTVVAGPGRRATLDGARLVVPARAPASSALGVLKAEARDRLARASDRYAGALGLEYSALALRDTRSRWGSCTAEGRLMYSWRLVMAPPEVLDYVAAHEVAHLRHMDHSPAFWSVVAGLCPDWKAHRSWLRHHGSGLHRYRFED